jgi:hypothetical protein
MIEVMFEDGVALGLMAGLLVMFLALTVLVVLVRENEALTLANTAWPALIYNACTSGVSAGAEISMIIGIWSEEGQKDLAGTILFSRLLFLLGGVFVALSVSGDIHRFFQGREHYSIYKELNFAPLLAHDMSDKYFKLTWTTVVCSCIDISTIQLLPWKKTNFYDLSEGYPSRRVMSMCLSLKLVQSIIAVTCEIAYVVRTNTLSSDATPAQARLIFMMNIMFGVATVVTETLILIVRGTIYGNYEKKEETTLHYRVSVWGALADQSLHGTIGGLMARGSMAGFANNPMHISLEENEKKKETINFQADRLASQSQEIQNQSIELAKLRYRSGGGTRKAPEATSGRGKQRGSIA